MKKIAMIISMLLLPIFFINAQNLIKLTLSACHSTANTFYFDLLIKNDGSGATGKSMVLNSFAFGIEFDYLGIGGGNLQIQYVDNSSTLHFNNISNFQNKTSVPYISIDNPRFNPITKQLQIVSPSATCTDGTVMAPSSEFRIGTFKVTNPNNDFTANSLAKLKFNITSTSGGFTQTKIQEFYDGACTINVTKWCSVNLLPTICFQPIPQVIETSCDNSGLVLNRTCIIPTTTMHAGVGEVLTITPMPGQGFGGTFAIGDVKLIDASNVDPNPNNDPSYALDTDDWNNPNNPTPPWDDQKIQVVLSSHSLINGEFFNPGSGKVKVIDINGNVFTSTTDLNIEYSISNSLNLGIKKTDKLARYKCDNGIKFYLGNNIGINSPERHDIEAACKTWSDYLNIDVKLSLNQQPPVVWELDYLSIISYANPNILNNTLIPMKTFSYITGCNTASSGTYNEPFITQADIIINHCCPTKIIKG